MTKQSRGKLIIWQKQNMGALNNAVDKFGTKDFIFREGDKNIPQQDIASKHWLVNKQTQYHDKLPSNFTIDSLH